MMKIAAFLGLTALFLLVGCATMEQANGYNETRLGPDVFRIAPRAGDASPEMAQDMALLRAAEFSIQHGYKFFAVIAEKGSTPAETFSSGSRVEYYMTYIPDETAALSTSETGVLIQGFQDKPDGIFTFDAAFLRQSLRQKYGIADEEPTDSPTGAAPPPMKSLYPDD